LKCLFDSSSIFRAIKENKIEFLTGNYTLELARYELGNIIWKECALHVKISEQEAKIMAKTINHTLNILEVIETAGSEEEVLDTAMEHKITFYDASYVYFSIAKELRLITEDSRLIKKVTLATNVSTLSGIK
jgi:predicted nucleic acid-binding protein